MATLCMSSIVDTEKALAAEYAGGGLCREPRNAVAAAGGRASPSLECALFLRHERGCLQGYGGRNDCAPKGNISPGNRSCAAGFVVVHNHPCGDASPSSADINLTRRIRKGARLLGITFLDHVIVGQPMQRRLGYYSFREGGVV
jgi:hypothetical protein